MCSKRAQNELQKAKSAHLTIAPQNKKGNNNYRKFKPHKGKNHSNTNNPPNSHKAQTKG